MVTIQPAASTGNVIRSRGSEGSLNCIMYFAVDAITLAPSILEVVQLHSCERRKVPKGIALVSALSFPAPTHQSVHNV